MLAHLVTDVRPFDGHLLDLFADARFTFGQIGAMAETNEECHFGACVLLMLEHSYACLFLHITIDFIYFIDLLMPLMLMLTSG